MRRASMFGMNANEVAPLPKYEMIDSHVVALISIEAHEETKSYADQPTKVIPMKHRTCKRWNEKNGDGTMVDINRSLYDLRSADIQCEFHEHGGNFVEQCSDKMPSEHAK
jgi:hypothetical protein